MIRGRLEETGQEKRGVTETDEKSDLQDFKANHFLFE